MLSTQCSFQPTLEFNPQLLSVCYCFQPTIAFHFCFQSAIVFNQLFNSTHYCSLPTIAFSHYCFQQLLSFQIHCHFTFQPTAPFNNKLWLSTHSNFQKATAFHTLMLQPTIAFNPWLLSTLFCLPPTVAGSTLMLSTSYCFQPYIPFNLLLLSTHYWFQVQPSIAFYLLFSTNDSYCNQHWQATASTHSCFQQLSQLLLLTHLDYCIQPGGQLLLSTHYCFHNTLILSTCCYWQLPIIAFNQLLLSQNSYIQANINSTHYCYKPSKSNSWLSDWEQ